MMAFLTSVAVLLAIVAFTEQSTTNTEEVERQIREVVLRRQQLARVRRVLNDMDLQLAALHKRSCLGHPGAIEQCDANVALGHSLDREYLNSLASPGKRSVNCHWGPNGVVECATEQLETTDEEYGNSLKSPGKRNAPKPNCKWNSNGFKCD